MKKRRAIILVIDALGIGAMPDAADYGDPATCNTLVNTAQACGGLRLPHLGALGLGNLAGIKGVGPESHPGAAYGKMAEASCGKDSTMMMMAIGRYAQALPANGNVVLLDHKHNRPSYSIYLSDQDLASLEVGKLNVAQFYARLMGRPDVKVSICKDWLGCVPVQLPNEVVLQMRNGQLIQVHPRL